jgi:hypothetical protein
MTEKEILAMKPGMDLNIKVAKDVMGHRVIKDETFGYMERFKSNTDKSSVFGVVQPYTEDPEIAKQVIEKMIEKGFEEASCWADFGGGAYTEAEAISKAALCAIARKRQKNEVADRILRQALGDDDEEDD